MLITIVKGNYFRQIIPWLMTFGTPLHFPLAVLCIDKLYPQKNIVNYDAKSTLMVYFWTAAYLRFTSSASSSSSGLLSISLRTLWSKAKSSPFTRCVCSTSPPRNLLFSIDILWASVVLNPQQVHTAHSALKVVSSTR